MIGRAEVLKELYQLTRFSITWAEVLVSGIAKGILDLKGQRVPLYVPAHTEIDLKWSVPEGMVYLILAGNLNPDTDHALSFEWILDGKTIYTDTDVVASNYLMPMINPSIPTSNYAMAKVTNKTDSEVYISMLAVWLEASDRLFQRLMDMYLGTVWTMITERTPWAAVFR